jgi:gamma-glutamyl:cysteine ligase YbdK (ATP-grasp superfamily)
VYRTNARSIPSITGQVIPEAVFSRAAYESQILQPMYRAIAPHDPARILQHEWLNSRGAIARFDRHTIEIRVLDVQEHPAADLAVCQAIVALLQALVAETWTPLAAQQAIATQPLAELLERAIRDADQAIVDHPDFLTQFGRTPTEPLSARVLWQQLLSDIGILSPVQADAAPEPLQVILEQGPLARRILRDLPAHVTRNSLRQTYGRLCDCLAQGKVFNPQRPYDVR